MCDHERYSSFEKEVEVIHSCECGKCHVDDVNNNDVEDRESDNYVYEYEPNESPHYNDADTRLHELQERMEERRMREEEIEFPAPASRDEHRRISYNVHDPSFR